MRNCSERASRLRSSPRTWARHLARGPSKPCVGPTFRTWVRRYAPGSDTSHVGPMACAWARHFARGSDGMRLGPTPRTWVRWHARGRRPGAYLGVGVRVAGLTRIVSGSRASDTPGQAPLRPQRRPPCPRHPVVGVCYRGGLRLGRRAAPRRDLTDSKRGELHH